MRRRLSSPSRPPLRAQPAFLTPPRTPHAASAWRTSPSHVPDRSQGVARARLTRSVPASQVQTNRDSGTPSYRSLGRPLRRICVVTPVPTDVWVPTMASRAASTMSSVGPQDELTAALVSAVESLPPKRKADLLFQRILTLIESGK